MPTFKRFNLGALSTLALLAFSGSLAAAAAFPYPQNRNYAYGSRPVPFGANAAADASTILAKYNSWLSQKRVTVSTGPNVYRIQAEDLGNDTVSEGISYGMLLAVYFNDQDTFDGLWRYKVSKNDGLGLMHWRISPGGGIAGSGSATDADEDIAYAMYLAHYQWGSAGTLNYKGLADAEMTKIVAYDLDSNRIKPGDSFNDCRYPSYFFPNEYRVFAKEKPGDAATWSAVRTNVYATIASAARNNTTGLMAEQCTDNGQGGGCSVSSTQYKYNSARIPFRMALDYVYYGDANAQGELTRLASHFGAISPGSVVDCYNLNGTTCGGNNHGAFVGPAGTAFMVNGSASLQSYYNYLMVTDYSSNYFGGALSLLSLLLLSGNMPNIGDQGAMFTPTVTRTVSPYAGTPTVTPTVTPIAFAYVFEDFENAILVNQYTYAGPATAPAPTISHGLSNAQNNTPGGTFSDLVQVYKPTNGQYAGVGFDSSYAPASGVRNFTGATSVRVAIRTDRAASMNISFREGNGVAGGDDEVWTSQTLAVAASASWQIISFPISGFTENIYNTCNPNCLTSGNNTFNLSSVKAAEIAFPSIIAVAANIYLDDISFVPSVVPTMTYTKTPFPNPYSQLYDDFESASSLNSTVPRRVTGYADTANSASTSWALDTSTYVAGAASGRLNYNLGTAPVSYGGGFSFMSPYNQSTFTSPNPLMAGAVFDASGAVQLQFWMNAPAGLKYRMTLQEAGSTATAVAGADGESWYSALLTGTGTWQRVTVDIGEFVEDPYNPTCNPAGTAAPGPCLTGAQAGNNIINLNALWQVGIKLPGEQVGVASRTGSAYFDDVTFITTFKSPTVTRTSTVGAGSPTPTASPSPTRSASPTATPTASPSATRSASPTASPSPTSSASPSASPTPSRTLTATGTGTPSPTRTESPTPSATPSASPTRSPTGTATPSRTLSATSSATLTATSAGTSTATPTHTAFAGTPTSTFTVTLSGTPSATPTATPSGTPTSSATRTSTGSATPTSSLTASPSPSCTATATPTRTPAGSATATPTDVPGTATASPTATLSFTVLPSATSTASATGAATGTPTLTPSGPTATSTASATMGTGSATGTPSASPTPAASAGATATRSATASPGATATSTSTPSPTRSATPLVPVLSGLGAAPASGAAGTLAVNGTQFLPGTQVLLDGFALSTAFVSGTQVDASLPALAPGTYAISVSNPGGLVSGALSLIIIAGPVATPTATPTLTPGMAPTAAPASGGAALILETRAYPNPDPVAVGVRLSAAVDSMEVKVYTKAMLAVGTCKQGAAAAGWVQVALPVWDASPGLYYYVVTAKRNGSEAKGPGSGKFIVLK